MSGYDRQYIGVLTESQESGKDNIFINNNNAIQYRIRSLLLPTEDDIYVSGYMSNFEDPDVVDDDEYAVDEEDRIQHFYQQVEEKLFVYTYRVKSEGYQNILNTNLVARPEAFDSQTMFYALPVFAAGTDKDISDWEVSYNWHLYHDYSSKEEFINCIRNKKPLGSVYGYDVDAFAPSFVIWRETGGNLLAVGNIVSSTENTLHSVILECDSIFTIDLSDYIKYCVYDSDHNPCVIFIPEHIYKKVEDEIHKAVVKQRNQQNTVLKDVEEKKEDKEDIDEKIDAKDELLKNDVIELKKPVKENLIEIDTSEKNDELIIAMMEYHSENMKLYYSKRDFINFHTAVKCSNLVILSGLSGTGKSSLVDIYAKALGISSSDEFLVIPVRPSWNDDSDLLGYVDLVHMVYRASDSGFIDLLVRAQENKNKMYLVCFDEMNLARVEHYFSQFLSILERPAKQRILQLYDKQYSGRLYNSKEYPNEIMIGDNIRFIGTVNIDETTYHFSDKVLDRANVIDLTILNYSKEWEPKNYAKPSSVQWTHDDYNGIINTTLQDNNKEVEALLWDIHTLLQSASAKYGVGPRIVKSIQLYLQNLPKTTYPDFTLRDAIDCQVAQRVLTKVRGPENILGDILNEKKDPNFIKLFDKYSDLSDFKKCREVIRQKESEIASYGYCI